MDVLTKFLNGISYKFPKGYPNINDPQDKILIESEFKKIGIILEENGFNALTFYDLKKRGGPRFTLLADKIESNEPFNLVNGEATPLKFINPNHSEVFRSQDADEIRKLAMGQAINIFPFFIDDSGSKYSISDLLKDEYFGGRGKGAGTRVEDINLILLNNLIKEKIKENEDQPISIEVNGKTYEDIIGAKTQPGVPKSDFNLIDIENNPVVFISHKKAGGAQADAGDFIRWGGYTQYADHPEVKEFNNALRNFLQKNNLQQLPLKSRFVSRIKDKELIRKLIYGPKYGSEEHSKDNINAILQGIINLVPLEEGLYQLTAQKTFFPPEMPEGEYTPYLASSYRADRNMFGIPTNEAIVMTEKTVSKSSNIYNLENGKFVKIK